MPLNIFGERHEIYRQLRPKHRAIGLPVKDTSDTLLRELVEVMGDDATHALIDRFGGTRLGVPIKLDVGHPIVTAIGMEAAMKLAARFAPDFFLVPLAREFRARRWRRSGYSHAQIAVALGLSEGGVLKLMRRLGDGAAFYAPSVETFVALVGKNAALALATAFGGAHLDMPPDETVVQAIGSEAADALAEAFPTGVLEVPVARELRALDMRANGAATSRIATALCMTERDVTKIFHDAHAFAYGR